MDLNVSEYNVGVFHNVNKITISSGWSKLSAHGVNELVRKLANSYSCPQRKKVFRTLEGDREESEHAFPRRERLRVA